MEIFSALLALCAGNSPVYGEFPAQRPVTRSFDDFFDLRLNKRLSKQSWCWWFETPSSLLWRHCNAMWVLWMYERDLNLDAIIFQQQFSVFSPAKVRLKQQPQAFIHCSKRRRMTIRLVWLLMLLFNQTANQKKDNELPICKYFSSKVWSTAVRRSTPRLTHWGRDKMAVVSQTTSSNAFSGMKILEFRLRCHWSLFLRVQLTIIQHWFR